MVIDPRSREQVESDLRDAIEGKLTKLTNFVESSFNGLFVRIFGNQFHEIESKLLAAQLSGFVRYAGRDDLDETDFQRLGVTGVDPEEVNQFMDQSQLDRLGEIVGVERDGGQRATGSVTVQTATDTTRVPEGMLVATQPRVGEDNTQYRVDADGDGEIGESGFVTPDTGQTSVTVDVIAEEVGDNYNVGSGSITFLPSPPPGVQSVVNNAEVAGGVDEQIDEELREDIQNAVFETSGGGTARGIEGNIESQVDGVVDVSVDEFPDRSPPTVDVIVDGGSTGAVSEAIEDSRPVGIRHTLVRPGNISVGTEAEVLGTGIDTDFLADRIEDFYVDLSLGNEFSRSRLIQRILNVENDIVDIGSLTVLVESVSKESERYVSGQDVYELDSSPLGVVTRDEILFRNGVSVYPLAFDDVIKPSVRIGATAGSESLSLERGTDFEVIDADGDGAFDSIDFSVGGINPDNETTLISSYQHNSITPPATITDQAGETYVLGIDYEVIDSDADGAVDSVDWSVGGNSPAVGDLFFLNYEPGRIVTQDLSVSEREKISAGQQITADAFESREQ